MRPHKLLLGIVACSLCFAVQVRAQVASIVNSVHNLNNAPTSLTVNGYGNAPGTLGQVCLPCHTPHNATSYGNNGTLLWNHDVNLTQSYTMYTTVHVTQNSGVGGTSYQPELDTTSHLCLSCHDGSIAIDSYGGKTNGTIKMGTLASFAAIAGSTDQDLSADHPLGVGYPGLTSAASVSNGVITGTFTQPGGWVDPTQTGWSVGGIDGLPSVNLVLLPTGLVGVGCGTCHEPHDNTFGFVRMSNNGSALCLKCHAK